ncbi:GntR family transcriptional regulator [Breoghania corrubedonensis]|uniref:GntR family transcriptional regulator n=1 Tax=Breoghania corrubedonensis TaxID=665038 RepID=A0A2T5VGB1_9HYPH|nr:PLP-dependent aminotransferase family protein [Breoghania corrubedonensis]PTW62804.1 GntR family transcriptional regulator [Breoghania corrubedonensis]
MKTQAGALLSSIRVDRDGGRKITVQLYMALRDLILSGGVKAGERLPASRTLATELGLSRTTVSNALDRLITEGLLEARVGSGTYVNVALQGQQRMPRTASANEQAPRAEPRLSHATSHAARHLAERGRLPHRPLPFVTALPAVDAFPMAHWARLSARHWRTDRREVMGYGDPFGLPRLRAAIATHLNALRGIRCDPAQVFIVGGAQQAFSLIGGLLLNPGDRIWFENPGAIGARNALVSSGADLVPVSVDEHGMVVAQGLERAPHFRLAFVTPSHQQPLGHVMSLARRLELLQAAEDSDALIIEDDYDGEFPFSNQPHPPLRSIDTRGRVIYVGTFSKSLFPALRIGFILAPDGLVDTFSQLSMAWLSGVPTAPQATIADFIEEGLFATHIRAMRHVYQERYAALMEAFAPFAGCFDVQPTNSGFHTIGLLCGDVGEDEAVERAAARGVQFSPLSRYCLEPIDTHGLVIGFGSSPPHEIRRAAEALKGWPGRD